MFAARFSQVVLTLGEFEDYFVLGFILYCAFVSGCFCVKFKKLNFYGVASESLGFTVKVFLLVLFKFTASNKFHVTSRCSTTPALRASVGQFLSRLFCIGFANFAQKSQLKTCR